MILAMRLYAGCQQNIREFEYALSSEYKLPIKP
jgi:hypothetical protein